jgi:hypothetical protein
VGVWFRYAKAAAAQPPCAKAMFYLAERYRIGNFFDAEREARGTVKPGLAYCL